MRILVKTADFGKTADFNKNYSFRSKSAVFVKICGFQSETTESVVFDGFWNHKV